VFYNFIHHDVLLHLVYHHWHLIWHFRIQYLTVPFLKHQKGTTFNTLKVLLLPPVVVVVLLVYTVFTRIIIARGRAVVVLNDQGLHPLLH
jgi:hypothetical protein